MVGTIYWCITPVCEDGWNFPLVVYFGNDVLPLCVRMVGTVGFFDFSWLSITPVCEDGWNPSLSVGVKNDVLPLCVRMVGHSVAC